MPLKIAAVRSPSILFARLKTTVAAIIPMTVTTRKNSGLVSMSLMLSFLSHTASQKTAHIRNNPEVAKTDNHHTYCGLIWVTSGNIVLTMFVFIICVPKI